MPSFGLNRRTWVEGPRGMADRMLFLSLPLRLKMEYMQMLCNNLVGHIILLRYLQGTVRSAKGGEDEPDDEWRFALLQNLHPTLVSYL